MKTRLILITSVILNILFLSLITSSLQYNECMSWVESRLPFSKKTSEQIPQLPLPSIDGRILMIGDSHLAIHPWLEYSSLPFSNRAVSGSRIKDINIEAFNGYPSLIVVSTSTNDIQSSNPLTMEEIKTSLRILFSSIENKWPDSIVIYISEPYPNVELYEKYFRAKYPNNNRPMPEQIESIRNFVSSLGIITIQAKSANIDGLHIDIESAHTIKDEIEKIFHNKSSYQQSAGGV